MPSDPEARYLRTDPVKYRAVCHMNPEAPLVAGPARCSICGQELPPNVPSARCPHCLLKQGLGAGPGAEAETVVDARCAPNPGLPQPGQVFGHYRLGRQLGAGGMGAVFEAEDLDSGRRVALKVLAHRLDSPEARRRFLREGRLAAAVNHPNSVYVFGTEDIAGVPVIAMELVAGGTLRDRVVRQGSRPVAEAVGCGLQIIAGLEAAQQAGILHRDIKPSNCFVEADGTVKIGDFGLSISAFVRGEPSLTATGAFLGTPAFSSPEQLRGDEVTVRSDIYAVGVTLYFLLTGRHPFEAPDMVRLLATVLERRAESPSQWRPELPDGLCRVVLRCLEKDPEKRFRNYDELRRALLPHAARTVKPATLGLRLAAYVLDALLLVVPTSALNVLASLLLHGGRGAGRLEFAEAVLTQLTPFDAPRLLLHNLCGLSVALLYFSLLEGLGGASFGKRMCGLRVVGPDHAVPGVPRALLRAIVVTAAPTVAWLLAWNSARAWAVGSAQFWLAGLGLLVLPTRMMLFVTARQRNGFAAVHDLISATRVIVPDAWQARPKLGSPTETSPETPTLPLVGPFHVLQRMDQRDGREWLLGFDDRLMRRVWIHRQPPGAPSTATNRRHVSRPGRLRWLAARRNEGEAWDAYEAVPGQALLRLAAQPQEWSRVRHWLLDLAEELLAATQDGTLPDRLSLDQVWITADGRAKLLDCAAPNPENPGNGPTARSDVGPCTPTAFLSQVVAVALRGLAGTTVNTKHTAAVPLPLHAARFLETLTPETDLQTCASALRSIVNLPVEVSRTRRALLLAAALVFPLFISLVSGVLLNLRRGVLIASPELATLNECLVRHHELNRPSGSDEPGRRIEREAFETFIAGRFAPILTNAARWDDPITRAVIAEPLRADAIGIMARRGTPSAAQLAVVSVQVEAYFKQPPEAAARAAIEGLNPILGALAAGYGATVALVIIPCLVGSLYSRGGALVHLFGIVLVTGNGRPASRWRVTGRNLLAWLPLLLLPAAAWIRGTLHLSAVTCLAAAVAVSLLLPKRGLADRLAGTWPVPR